MPGSCALELAIRLSLYCRSQKSSHAFIRLSVNILQFIRYIVICGVIVDSSTGLTPRSLPPRTFLGVRHAFLPHEGKEQIEKKFSHTNSTTIRHFFFTRGKLGVPLGRNPAGAMNVEILTLAFNWTPLMNNLPSLLSLFNCSKRRILSEGKWRVLLNVPYYLFTAEPIAKLPISQTGQIFEKLNPQSVISYYSMEIRPKLKWPTAK